MQNRSSSGLQLVLGTGAFALCFAVFGSMSAMMPIISKHMALSPVQKSIAIALPVLLGSLGRIPLGILTDRFGGRMSFQPGDAVLHRARISDGTVSATTRSLLTYGFFIGVALASFSVGVRFVTGWYPPERQGFALGVYGAGNIGQSLAAYGSPVLAAAIGFKWGFWTFGILLSIWLVIFATMARNAPNRGSGKILCRDRPPSERQPQLGAQPVLLPDLRRVRGDGCIPPYASYRSVQTHAAGCRLPHCRLCRTGHGHASGGRYARGQSWRAHDPEVGVSRHCTDGHLSGLSDDVHLHRLARWGWQLPSDWATARCSSWSRSTFPKSVGGVTGLVGAAGGLGGFFPPLLLGVIKQQTGTFTFGFVLLGVFALACLAGFAARLGCA